MEPVEDHKDLLLIERYLQNQLSDTELEKFEERLKQDQGLREQVQEHRMTLQLMEAYEEEQLRSTLDSLGKEYRQDGAKVRPLWQKGLAVAASIAAVIILLILFAPGLFQRQQGIGQLAHEYFEKSEKPNVVMLGGDVQSTWANIKELFQQEKYSTVIDSIIIHRDSLTQYPASGFLLGYSYHSQQEFDLAIAAYKSVPSNTEASQKTNWWLALAYLQTNQNEPAEPILESLAAQTGPFHSDAEKLLQKLHP